uniref:G_PROTEIN_RECEP_F1_2 domain-containing protein n=1 Tax=Macrostomum lignano TaxID=282301 RepID=A0A1I8GMZ6_9PLAT
MQEAESSQSLNNSPVSNSSLCGEQLQLDHRSVVTGMVLGLIALGTVFGNSLVLLAVLLHRNLRSTTAIFVSNLAVADLLLGSCVLPLSSVLEVTGGCWLFGPLLCDLWACVDVLCCTASIMSLCAISLDRYIGVTRPLQHSRIVSHRRACMLVLAVWLLSFLVSVGPLLGWRKSQDGEQRQQCNVSNDPGYILFSVLFSFYLPLGIVVFFYIRIYREAVKQNRFLASGVKTTRTAGAESRSAGGGVGGSGNDGGGGGNGSDSAVTLRVHRGGGAGAATAAREQRQARLQVAGKLARFKHEKKAAKTLGIVVGVFILCWLPFFFLYPFKSIFCKSCDIPELVFKVAFWLGYCNSLCNPVIYACWNRDFKRAFASILTCDRLRGRRSEASSSKSDRPVLRPPPRQQPLRHNRRLLQSTDCGTDLCLTDDSYFQKCANCPAERQQSPLLSLIRLAQSGPGSNRHLSP